MCADSDSLYRELKPQIEQLGEPLFDASKLFVQNRGAFLPHGAVLSADGTVELMMAAPDGDTSDQGADRASAGPLCRALYALSPPTSWIWLQRRDRRAGQSRGASVA